MLKKLYRKITTYNKFDLLRNFLFVFIITIVYSLCVNIPIINMQYPEKYFLLTFVVSIFRDFIIWFIAFLNRWVFAVFTLLTFIAGFGLRYMNKYLHMDLSIGNFEVIFATNFNEAKGVLNNILVTHFIIGILLALFFIILRFNLNKIIIFSSNTNNARGGGETGFYFSSL